MKYGELSNELAPAVGFRFERLIKTEEGRLNKSVKGFIQNVLRGLDVNVYIITTGDRRKTMAFLMKWAVPYTQVIEAESTLEIPDIVRENRVLTYYEYDIDIIQNVNSRGGEGVKAKQWIQHEVL